MSYTRRLKLTFAFWLIKLEQKKFDAWVKAFRILRNVVLDNSEVDDKPAHMTRFQAEDAFAGEATTKAIEQNLFMEVGRALSTWAYLEEIMVCIVSLLLTNSVNKAGVVMYSIINFGTWLIIISELFPHDELYAHLKPNWDKLTSRLRALKDVRDRLAHHSAFKSEIPAKFFKLTTIAPSPYDVRAKSMRYKPISPLEIGQFIITVTDVAKELAALVNEMEKIKFAHIEMLDAEIAKISGPNAYNKAVEAMKPKP